MAVNKVVYGTTVLVDLTNDSVTPETLAVGVTAHDAKGEQIVGTMESGGGGSSEEFEALLENHLTELNSNATSVCSWGCRGRTALVTVNLPKATAINTQAFYNCTKLKTASIPVATKIGSEAFRGCSALQSVTAPMVTTLDTNIFYGCSVLASIDLPKATSVPGSCFYKCVKMKKADFGALASIAASAFNGCSILATLILRKADAICTLANTNAFTGTDIADGTGYIYVPSALINSYKAATNWSTFASQFRAIEDYPDICG